MSAPVFVEVRSEEIPASYVRPALEALARGVVGLLEGIAHGDVRTYATPRRLAVVVDDVAAASPVVEKLVTGPPADRAFKDGEPTKAAIGFARGKGIDVSDLQIVDGPKGRVIAAPVREGGESTLELLARGLEQVVLGLPFPKSMTWGAGHVRFARPLHGVSALHGDRVVQATVAGMPIDNETFGHRLADDTVFSFDGPAAWLQGLRDRYVEPDLEVRKARIAELLVEASSALGADPIEDPALLEEVTHLVEWPVCVLGRFDEDLLELPPKLLVTSMKAHQRYFPVHEGGALTNRFVVISNNPFGDADVIADGNARVLRARFYDARFFLAEDRKRRLEEHAWALEKMRWIRGLGTMAEKQERISALAGKLAPLVGADADVARRAGALSKADLATQMVGEFPELQGHMGRIYALGEGEPEAVAVAVEEHYQPAGGHDDPPTTREGVAVALADRLDTLVGCFGLGMVPKGGGDPQGLRRAAAGIVTLLVSHGIQADLAALFGLAFDTFDTQATEIGAPAFDRWVQARGAGLSGESLVADLVGFTLARFKASETAAGATADLVDAVLAAGGSDPLVLHGKVDALKALAGTADFLPVMQTFKRVLNISRDADFPSPRYEDLGDPAEEALMDAIGAAEGDVSDAVVQLDFARALDAALTLQAPVARFFDAVLVDSPDPAVKAVRMGLLLRISALFLKIADFSRISTR